MRFNRRSSTSFSGICGGCGTRSLICTSARLYTNFVVYPFVSPLAGHTLALLWGLISAPFQMIFGLIPTFNAIVVLAFVLAGVAMYAFVRKHVQRASVALLAGLIFAFTPAMIQRASVGHLDKISIFWLPLCLLLWDKVIETRRWTWAVITGLCLYLSWLTDFQQTMWTLLLLGPYVIYTVFFKQSRHGASRACQKGSRRLCLRWLIHRDDRAGRVHHSRLVRTAAAVAGSEQTQLSARAIGGHRPLCFSSAEPVHAQRQRRFHDRAAAAGAGVDQHALHSPRWRALVLVDRWPWGVSFWRWGRTSRSAARASICPMRCCIGCWAINIARRCAS